MKALSIYTCIASTLCSFLKVSFITCCLYKNLSYNNRLRRQTHQLHEIHWCLDWWQMRHRLYCMAVWAISQRTVWCRYGAARYSRSLIINHRRYILSKLFFISVIGSYCLLLWLHFLLKAVELAYIIYKRMLQITHRVPFCCTIPRQTQNTIRTIWRNLDYMHVRYKRKKNLMYIRYKEYSSYLQKMLFLSYCLTSWHLPRIIIISTFAVLLQQ